jgi:hypothetical protein
MFDEHSSDRGSLNVDFQHECLIQRKEIRSIWNDFQYLDAPRQPVGANSTRTELGGLKVGYQLTNPA